MATAFLGPSFPRTFPRPATIACCDKASVTSCGISKSNGEARRLIEQGGISLNGEKITDTNLKVSLNLEEIVIKKGKKIYHRVIAL